MFCADTGQAQPNQNQETINTSIPEKTLSLLDVVDGLPVLTNSVLLDLAEDGEGRLAPVSRLGTVGSPRCRYEQTPNLGIDVPATPSRGQGLTGFIHENFWRQGYLQQSVSGNEILFH
ncbi:unnamed protein product [Parnassius mnemosyne]|uniref:Uncharacterized protein n=1 Tax=Parnassius mnemosyne TaxID=213953 RepID=A0AAV1L9X6_9NEOP